MVTLNCIECGEKFEAQRSTAKFCSPNCRVKWNNKKSEEILPEQPPITSKTKLVVEPSRIKETLSDESKKEMRDFTEKINKDFGEGTVMFMGDRENKGIEVVPTGSYLLDRALGIGGLPIGRMVEIFGLESSGKSTISLHVIANAQKLGMKCLLVDAENSFDPEYAASIGVNIDDLMTCQPSYGEQGFEVADRYIVDKKANLVVFDSVAAMIPKAELEGEVGDSKMGLHARLMSQVCRKMVGSISKTNTLAIFINQIRNKIGVMYGSPEVTTGGMALQFYASVRLDVRRLAQIKDGEVVMGNRVKVKVVKNKCSAPHRFAEFDILYGEGIDNVGELIDLAVEKNIIQKSGSWYSYDDRKLGQGKDGVRELLKSNPEFLHEIELKIK